MMPEERSAEVDGTRSTAGARPRRGHARAFHRRLTAARGEAELKIQAREWRVQVVEAAVETVHDERRGPCPRLARILKRIARPRAGRVVRTLRHVDPCDSTCLHAGRSASPAPLEIVRLLLAARTTSRREPRAIRRKAGGPGGPPASATMPAVLSRGMPASARHVSRSARESVRKRQRGGTVDAGRRLTPPRPRRPRGRGEG